MFQLAGQAISGLVIGTLAMLRKQGPDTGNVVVTALIGLAGSVMGTIAVLLMAGQNHSLLGWIISIGGAIAMIRIYRFIAHRKFHRISTGDSDPRHFHRNTVGLHLVKREGRRQ